jgi:hypothetical protein
MRGLYANAVLAVACLLVVASPLVAAPAIRAVAPVDVQPGGFAKLTVDGADPNAVIWNVSPEAVQDDTIAGTFVFTGERGKTYTVVALVAEVDFAAKAVKFTKLKQTVRFLGEPGPVPPVPPTPPGPTPPPDPPPLDPLAAALKSAAAADGIGSDGLRSLVAAFTAVADLTKNRSTVADLQTTLDGVLVKAVPKKPAATWAVLTKELAALEAVAPTDRPDKVLSDADKTTAADLFRKLAGACKAGAN